MEAVQWDHHCSTWRDDLLSLALEFRLGHRDPCWIDTLDDRRDAADVRAHSAKARHAGNTKEWNTSALRHDYAN